MRIHVFPVGGAVILIDDDRLAEALLGLSQENHYHER